MHLKKMSLKGAICKNFSLKHSKIKKKYQENKKKYRNDSFLCQICLCMVAQRYLMRLACQPVSPFPLCTLKGDCLIVNNTNIPSVSAIWLLDA